MAVTFHKIRFKNILSVGDSWIEVQLDANPMTLIVGKNGQGKSTILDAIVFGLYGVAFRDINKPQLVNTYNRKELVVEVSFSIGPNVYLVRRGIKPNIFEVYKNDELIPEDAKTGDYQKQFETTILGINQKTFRQVSIIGAATFEPFMRLKPADRRMILENLLDCRIFTVMGDLAKIEAKALRSELGELEERSVVLRTKIDGQIKLIERQKESHDLEIQRCRADYELGANKVTDNKKRLAALGEQRTEQYIKLKEIAADPDKIRQSQTKLVEQIAVLRTQKNNLSQQQITSQEFCSVCKQKIDEAHREHINSEAARNTKEVEERLAVALSRKQLVDKLASDYNSQLSVVHDVEQAIETLESTTNHYQNGLKQIQDKIDALSNRKHVEADTKELESLQTELTDNEAQVDVLDKGLKVLKSVVEQCGDTGMKANLISKYIPIVNHTLNEYLERLDLFAQFELDEQFNETVKSHYRDTFSYASFSEGQKLRIDLAVLLTWRKIAATRDSVATNLLIMDEVLDRSLDVEGTNNFMDLLTEIFKDQQLFVISHNPNVIEQFDNVIEVTQSGNFTEYNSVGAGANRTQA